jgi:hypothetical protein
MENHPHIARAAAKAKRPWRRLAEPKAAASGDGSRERPFPPVPGGACRKARPAVRRPRLDDEIPLGKPLDHASIIAIATLARLAHAGGRRG